MDDKMNLNRQRMLKILECVNTIRKVEVTDTFFVPILRQTSIEYIIQKVLNAEKDWAKETYVLASNRDGSDCELQCSHKISTPVSLTWWKLFASQWDKNNGLQYHGDSASKFWFIPKQMGTRFWCIFRWDEISRYFPSWPNSILH